MIEIRKNPEQTRYEARDGDEVVGLITYRHADGVLALLHTEVNKDREGQGIAGQIARAALEDAAESGVLLNPVCPYVRGYLDKHPDLADRINLVR